MKDLVVAGIRFRLAELDDRTRETIESRMPEFLAEPQGEPDLHLHARWAGDDADPDFHGGADATIERTPGHIRARRGNFDGTFDRAPGGEARLVWRGEIAGLNSFLRVASSFAVLDRGGVLLHASSVLSSGRVYCFAGPSGTGKTTIAGLGAPRPVLSDEVSALLPSGGEALRFTAHPTSFWGDMVRVKAGPAGPLALLGFPVHASSGPPVLRPASQADAFARLVECVIAFDLTRAEQERLFEILTRITSSTPRLHVEYALAEPPWDRLDAFVASAVDPSR